MSLDDAEVAQQLLELAKGAGLDDESARKLLTELFKSVEVAPSSGSQKESKGPRVRSLDLRFIGCEDSADRRIVEAQEACHLHLAIAVRCNSFGDEPIPGCFASAPL